MVKLPEITEKERKEIEKMIPGSYSPLSFDIANRKDFLAKLEEIEEEREKVRLGFPYKLFFKNFQVPLLMLFGGLFSYWLWRKIPFTHIFQQMTLSEYTIQKQYYHTIFTSALGFKLPYHMYLYYTTLFFSTVLLARRFKTKHFLSTFLINSVLCSLVTLCHKKKDSDTLMKPQVAGSQTSLFYLGAVGGVLPVYNLGRLKKVPLFLLPIIFFMYEFKTGIDTEEDEFRDESICHASNCMAIVFGAVSGAYLRRFGQLSKIF